MTASRLYSTYLSSKDHTAATGASTKIQNKEGARFKAWGNYIGGKNLQLVKDTQIVQSWRASDWSKSQPDSTLVLLFEDVGENAVITMVHANVPDKEFDSLKKGWNEYYWNPWKKYFSTRKNSN